MKFCNLLLKFNKQTVRFKTSLILVATVLRKIGGDTISSTRPTFQTWQG